MDKTTDTTEIRPYFLLPSSRQSPRNILLSNVEPLATTGAGLLVILLVNYALHIRGISLEQAKSLDYAAFIIQLPVTTLLIASCAARQDPVRRNLLCVVGVVGLLFCTFYGLLHSSKLCFVAALAQLALAWHLDQTSHWRSGVQRTIYAIVSYLVTLAAWSAAVRLPWWRDYSHAVLTSIYGVPFIPVLFLCATALYTGGQPLEKRVSVVLDAVTVIIIVLASTRTVGLFSFWPLHHWGVFVAPAEMVRQGGWLLWDVPSQYGFLSIALPAIVPHLSVWNALYLLTCASQIAGITLLYYVLRSNGGGIWFRIVCSAVTIVTVYISPMIMGRLAGTEIFPSTTAYRFIWEYAELAAVWRLSRGALDGRGVRLCLVGGSIAWTLGLLWSYESAFYTSAVWLPAYCAFLIQKRYYRSGMEGQTPDLAWCSDKRALVAWAFLPIGLAGAAFGLVEVVYHLHFGHGPDWTAYSEYATSFKHGFGRLPLDTHGSIWCLYIAASAATSSLVAMIAKAPADSRIPLLAGAVGMVASTTAYCIGRSHPNNILNVLPFAILALFVAIGSISTLRGANQLRFLQVSCTIPILTVLLATASHKFNVDIMFLRTLVTAHSADVDRLRQPIPTEEAAFLERSGVASGDPIFFYDLNVMPAEPTRNLAPRKYLTPFSPLASIYPLSHQRAAVYLDRFESRMRSDGWLLASAKSDLTSAEVPYDITWLMPALYKHFVVDKRIVSSNYTLLHLKYKH